MSNVRPTMMGVGPLTLSFVGPPLGGAGEGVAAAGVTTMVLVAFNESIAARMVTVPAAAVVTRPAADTVAIVESLDDQTTCAGKFAP